MVRRAEEPEVPTGVKKLVKREMIRKQRATPSVRRLQKVMLGIKRLILWKTVNMSLRELDSSPSGALGV